MTAVRLVLSAIFVAVIATAAAVLWPAPSESRASATAGGVLDTEVSIEQFERRIAATPSDAVSHTVLGGLYAQLGRETGSNSAYARSATVLQEALRLLPDYEPATRSLAATQVSRHRFDDAIDLARALLEDAPDDPGLLAVVVDAGFGMGDYAEAEAALDRLLDVDRSSGVLVRQAQLYEVTGRQRQALLRANEALTAARAEGLTGERLAWHMWRVGDLHRHVGELEAAQRLFEASGVALPGFHLALEGLADVAELRGDLALAVSLYEEVQAARPDDPGVMVALAALQAETGDRRSAELWRERAIGSWPDELDSIAVGGDYAAAFIALDHQLPLALELAEQQLQHRQDPGTWSLHAEALYALGRFDEARASADRSLVHGQQEPDWLYVSAAIWLALGDGGAAERDLAAANAINPLLDLAL